MKKRLLSLALSLAMLLTMLPVTVWAEGDVAEAISAACEIAVTPSQQSPGNGEDPFMGYLSHLGDGVSVIMPQWSGGVWQSSFPAMMGIAASDHLDEVNQLVYQSLKEKIITVSASGGSSLLSVPIEGISFQTISYTLDQINEGYEDKCTLFSAAKDAPAAVQKEAATAQSRAASLYTKDAGLSVDSILSALMADLPYELYWYDKTSATQSFPYVSMYTIDKEPNKIYCTGITKCDFYFPVAVAFAEQYSEGGQTLVKTDMVDAAVASGAQSAYTEAMKVVSDPAHKNDTTVQRLRYYMDWVCQKTSYNSEAASSTNAYYGNPWQILWVFDDVTTTNVVCEGYAKAFKFLCDLTEWSDDVSCLLVTGWMTGGEGAGNHMWNVVQVNGDNYLVDPTNCDENTIGWPDKLFLREWEAGQYDGIYSFTIDDDSSITYTYDAETLATFTPGELMLKGDPALPPVFTLHVNATGGSGDITATVGDSILQCDANGKLSFNAAGTYTVTLARNGCVTRTVTVTFTDDDTVKEVILSAAGDLNGTEGGNIGDMDCLYAYLFHGEYIGEISEDKTYFRSVADVNEDGYVNILDYQVLYEMVKAQ